MCPLGPPQNQCTFNSHALELLELENCLGSEYNEGLNLTKLLWEVYCMTVVHMKQIKYECSSNISSPFTWKGEVIFEQTSLASYKMFLQA